MMSTSSYSLARTFLVILTLATAMIGASATSSVAGKRAPLGYQLMCLENPAECRGGGKSSVVVTDDVMVVLKRVNSMVNRSIKPRRDQGADVWSVNASSGDCEDYVLAKRRALIKSGLPPSALRIAYVKTRKGEGHAILIVKTNGKDLVLDNLNGKVRPLSQSGYRILSMSGADPLGWS
ncbi:MAG: transglutaminase-like cysteine peptidase [Devosia sp.]